MLNKVKKREVGGNEGAERHRYTKIKEQLSNWCRDETLGTDTTRFEGYGGLVVPRACLHGGRVSE